MSTATSTPFAPFPFPLFISIPIRAWLLTCLQNGSSLAPKRFHVEQALLVWNSGPELDKFNWDTDSVCNKRLKVLLASKQAKFASVWKCSSFNPTNSDLITTGFLFLFTYLSCTFHSTTSSKLNWISAETKPNVKHVYVWFLETSNALFIFLCHSAALLCLRQSKITSAATEAAAAAVAAILSWTENNSGSSSNSSNSNSDSNLYLNWNSLYY